MGPSLWGGAGRDGAGAFLLFENGAAAGLVKTVGTEACDWRLSACSWVFTVTLIVLSKTMPAAV